MALTSPRFLTSKTLQNIEQKKGVLQKGSNGRAVHLVQMALIDLGHLMPISTTSVKYSPDGDFGEETKNVVKAFQKAAKLKDDGIIGQLTIRELDKQIGGFKHKVKLHFRSTALTNIPFARSLADTETVFAQYGIKAEFASGESLLLSAAQQDIFDKIDQSCDWDLNDGEFAELQKLGSPAPANDVLVFHVRELSDGDLGCGGHAADKHACTIASRASRWDTAHEIAHVLLTKTFAPVHINDTRNLMHPTAPAFADIPVLTDKQVVKIRASICCTAI